MTGAEAIGSVAVTNSLSVMGQAGAPGFKSKCIYIGVIWVGVVSAELG